MKDYIHLIKIMSKIKTTNKATTHAQRRINERIGKIYNQKNYLQTVSRKGFNPCDFSGDFRSWLLIKGRYKRIKVKDYYVFIFSKNSDQLITTYELPEQFKIQYYVKENNMNIKKIGNKCEQNTLSVLKSKGWWCHLFASQSGQPCDIIALKNDKYFLIDVKHCENLSFRKERIEPNQFTSFEYARRKGIVNTGFICFFELTQEYKFLSYEKVKNNPDKKSFHKNDMISLEEFLNEIDSEQ